MSEVLPWMTIARSYMGLKEAPGQLDNPAVVKLYALAGFPHVQHDSVPWCAAFLGAVLKQASLDGSRSLLARSYERWGKKLDGPLYGCVGVKSRRGGMEWQGHTGFVVAANEREIYLLGGNTNDMVTIAPFLRSEFTAFRWPYGVPLPDPAIPLPTDATGTAKQPKAKED